MDMRKTEKIVLDSGLWDDGRKMSHGFILSPSAYEISEPQKAELETLGLALQECLAGLGRIAVVALNEQTGRSSAWHNVAQAFRVGIPKIYHDIMLLRPNKSPSICKVDFMETMDGSYRIAEIDGHNKHGLGYSTLAARLRKDIMPEAKSFIGVAAAMAKEMRRRGSNELVLLYADQERFYLPEFNILKSELALHGVNLKVVAENDAEVESGKIFVDLPFLYLNGTLNSRLADLYRNGEIDFLIPPKPFLGSKVILALLRNDSNDEEMEAILKSQIRPAALEKMRQHIPETHLVHRRKKLAYWQALCARKKFVLKESISSGMKGTVFAGEERFGAMLQKAQDSYYRFILQEEIKNKEQRFRFFSSDGDILEDTWYARVTAHFALGDVADIVVTARRDKKVHGALDCLQLGAVIV